MELIKPKKLNLGDTIGVFTPSSPAYKANEELFTNGVKNIEKLGYKTKLGTLTQNRSSQGYRSGTPQERANEFMELIKDDSVHALISTIGGMNSSSMIPYLDFDLIRKKRKIICGFSDVTSLHLSILKYSGLKTLYGPAIMTWFGEYPDGIEESVESFLDACTRTDNSPKELLPFTRWSNHLRDWSNGDWKSIPRKWKKNEGWTVLQTGSVTAEVVVANLNTLMSSAGTPYFPEIEGKILLLEEMDAPWSKEERSFRQLQLMGVFDKISGLIIGKPEMPNNEGATFSLDELIAEIVGDRSYPIISNFDCSHTVPMHTIGERALTQLTVTNSETSFKLLEAFVE